VRRDYEHKHRSAHLIVWSLSHRNSLTIFDLPVLCVCVHPPFSLLNILPSYLHDEADANKVILHRDLKPDNVGFLAEGSLQLFDFGLATSVPRQPTSSESKGDDSSGGGDSSSSCAGGGGGCVGLGSGVVLPRYRMTGHTGSVRYMAPEVATDMPYNQAVDTYSFAMILW